MNLIKSWITDTLSAGFYQGAYGPGYFLAWLIHSVWRGYKNI